MWHDELFSLDEISKNRVQPEPKWQREELTLEQHRDIHGWEPGHKFAYKFKKGNSENGKLSAYSIFVKEMAAKEGKEFVPPRDYSRYGPRWEAMSAEQRLPYKEKAAAAAVEGGSKSKVIPWQLEERRESDRIRKTFGVHKLGFNQLVRLYYPPTSSEVRPSRGREHRQDLETLISLYALEEHDDILWEATMLDHIREYFRTKEDFCNKPIVLMGIIPASIHPDPNRCIYRPLEIYMTVTTLSGGLDDSAYHVFVDLDTTLMENPYDAEVWPWGFGLYEDRIQLAMKEAWNQAFFKHNIPFVRANFETESRKVFPVISHLNKHYNGWDEHARKKLPFNKNYAEIYKTIVELGSEKAKNDQSLLVFTKLQEVEMVGRCLKWLHEQAVKKLGADNVPKVSFEVCSLEHLAWQAGSVLGMEPTEKTIEQALANNCLTEDLQFKCGFHQSKPPSFVCARAATLTNVFNLFALLLPAFQLPPTENHFPYGDTDIRMPWLEAFGRAKKKAAKDQADNFSADLIIL